MAIQLKLSTSEVSFKLFTDHLPFNFLLVLQHLLVIQIQNQSTWEWDRSVPPH